MLSSLISVQSKRHKTLGMQAILMNVYCKCYITYAFKDRDGKLIEKVLVPLNSCHVTYCQPPKTLFCILKLFRIIVA